MPRHTCRAAGRPGGRAAGERAGLVDFNNYKTFNRLQEFQQMTTVSTDDNNFNRWQ